MSANAKVRTAGQHVAIIAGPYAGQNGRSQGPTGSNEVRVLLGSGSKVTVHVTDAEPIGIHERL